MRSETRASGSGDGAEVTVPAEEKAGGGGFFACYLLTSLSPRHKGQTYIGFTVNPRRRIRQHNGEIGCGAFRTKRKRPWEMVLCIYGFPTNITALQFEWAWQHPKESINVREAAAKFKSLSGLANKIKLAYRMLNLPSWKSLNLTLNFFSTKYTNHSAGFSLPGHMRVQVCSMDELPCYAGAIYENGDGWDDDDELSGETDSRDRFVDRLSDIGASNCEDHEKAAEEASDDQNRWMEEIDMGLSRDLLNSSKDYRQAACLDNSPVQASSSFSRGMLSSLKTLQKEGRYSFGLTEERNTEMEPMKRELPSLTATEKDQPWLINVDSPTTKASDEEQTSPLSLTRQKVEVIDILSPSPGYKISACSKKRKVSDAYPKIIDLTKSPILCILE